MLGAREYQHLSPVLRAKAGRTITVVDVNGRIHFRLKAAGLGFGGKVEMCAGNTGPGYDWADSGRGAFQPLENLYTLRPFHIASIESAGIVPTSS